MQLFKLCCFLLIVAGLRKFPAQTIPGKTVLHIPVVYLENGSAFWPVQKPQQA